MKKIIKFILLAFILNFSFIISSSQNSYKNEIIFNNPEKNNYSTIEESDENLKNTTNLVQPLATISGEQFTVKVVKVVNGKEESSVTLTKKCLQSTGHSGYNHSINLRDLANSSGYSGYKGYNWSQYETIPSSYTSGLTPNNNYASVHYYITGSAPYKARETLYLFFESSQEFTLNYNANGGSGAPAQQTATTTNSSYNFTVSSREPTKDGYKFLGWSTSSTATYPSYYAGSSINVTGSTTLYAVWEEKQPEKVTITYIDRGMEYNKNTYNQNTDVTIINCTNTRKSYTFKGWDTDKSAKTVVYEAGDTFTITQDTTLYAVWEKNEISTVQYKVEWYNVEGEILKPTEIRFGLEGEVVSVTEKDKLIDGYTFDANNQGNILNITLGNSNVLRLYFRQNEDNKEEPNPINPENPTVPENPNDPETPSTPGESTHPSDQDNSSENITNENNPITKDNIMLVTIILIISFVSFVLLLIKKKKLLNN